MVSPFLPAFGFEIVRVNVLAFRNGGDDPADIGSVLDRGVTLGEIGEGDLVTDWDILFGRKHKVAVVFGHDTKQLSACFDTLDDNDADIIAVSVN
jgi:hypothetical protein